MKTISLPEREVRSKPKCVRNPCDRGVTMIILTCDNGGGSRQNVRIVCDWGVFCKGSKLHAIVFIQTLAWVIKLNKIGKFRDKGRVQ